MQSRITISQKLEKTHFWTFPARPSNPFVKTNPVLAHSGGCDFITIPEDAVSNNNLAKARKKRVSGLFLQGLATCLFKKTLCWHILEDVM